MTNAAPSHRFEEINAEHRELYRRYHIIRTLLDGRPSRPQSIRTSLSDLAAFLKSHFAHEEEEGYFTDIAEMAPRLGSRVDAVQSEHDHLLQRLVKLDERIAIANELVTDYEAIRRDIGEFLDACHEHERRENRLVQDAYLVDIGTGD
jgi:iron-sulfur cluster repair protein YtfE (RIC family)